MMKDLLKHVSESNQVAFIRDLYSHIHTKEVEKIFIESRIKHLSRVGYNKVQIISSVSNEFDMSERSIYRYIKEVENGKD